MVMGIHSSIGIFQSRQSGYGLISTEYVPAALGGTGEAKTQGNIAGSSSA
jgi:hypothetical protein